MIGYINNQEVTFGENETVLSIAKDTGILSPPSMKWRICTTRPAPAGPSGGHQTEKQPERHIVTACTTPMEEGMTADPDPQVRRCSGFR
ncbi:MAG: hypothetical protein R2941_13700 [Desulfobacterales bacterium]